MKKTLLCLSLLLATVSSSVAIIGTWFGSQSSASSETPNIVFVLTDDMRKDDLRFVPETRRLVGGRGMEFENAFVTFAMCCPSRASILTGLYPHNHRVFTNEAPDGGEPGFRPKDGSTVAAWLDDAGYRTALFGKYFNDYAGVYRPPGWDAWHANETDAMTAQGRPPESGAASWPHGSSPVACPLTAALDLARNAPPQVLAAAPWRRSSSISSRLRPMVSGTLK